MSKRRDHIDVAKGIGIILVIAGHLLHYGSNVSNVIFSFHMPLFFFVSGLTASDRSKQELKPYLIKTAKKTLVPFAAVLAVGLAVTLLVPSYRAGFSPRILLIELIMGRPECVHVGQIWFLMCMFNVRAMFWPMNRFVFAKGSAAVKYAVAAALFPAAYFIGQITFPIRGHSLELPFKFGTSVMALAFYCAGYLLKSVFTEKEIGLKAGLPAALAALAVTFFSYKNGWTNIAMRLYNNIFLYILFAFSGMILTLLVSLLVHSSRVLAFLGRNSLTIFALHSLPMYLYCYILSQRNGVVVENGVNVSNTEALIGTVAITAVMAMFAWLYNSAKSSLQRRKMKS